MILQTSTISCKQNDELKPSYVRVELLAFTNLRDEETYYALMVDFSKIILRSRSTNLVNLTTLLSSLDVGIPKARLKKIIKNIQQEENDKGIRLVSYSSIYLRGLWVPVKEARRVVSECIKCKHIFWPLLHDDPAWFMGTVFYADKYGSLETNHLVSDPKQYE